MSNKVSYLQQKNTQTDTIKQSDTIGKKNNFKETFSREMISNKNPENQKSTLVKQIEEGYDVTSYIYSVSGDAIPLTDCFLNPAYFNELIIPAKSSSLSTITNDKSIIKKRDTGLGIDEADFLLLALIVLIALIGFVRISGKSYLQRTMSSILNFSFSNMLFNEKNKLFQLNDLVLMFVFYISTGMFFVTFFEYINIPMAADKKLLIYFSLIGITFVSISAYKFAIILIGIFLTQYKVVSEHLFYVNNVLKILGILTVIALFGILFAPENTKVIFIFLILFCYIIAYITRGFKMISDFLTNQFSLFYMILYFCALEIVPIVMIGKLVFGVYQNKIELYQYLF
ncbi:MAG: DUF4271 domain-containing protein [Bacteroidota bacterium]